MPSLCPSHSPRAGLASAFAQQPPCACTATAAAPPCPRYTQSLSRRGLHRTALEVCKLLLALNADDPLGARFAVDYLALRAGR